MRFGGNVQRGQPVVISCDISQKDFGHLVQECAYDAGAYEVIMNWSDEHSTRTKYLRADGSIFDDFPAWLVNKYNHLNGRGAVYLNIGSHNPDLLFGVERNRINRYVKASSVAMKEHKDLLMGGNLRWSMCAVPSVAWAKKVFSELSETEAVEKLWEYILKGARADGVDPISDWERHRKNLNKRAEYLNNQNFDTLRITTGLGTDLTIGLVKNHIWTAGGDIAKDGVEFLPNIPTEEVFTMPNFNCVDGRVVASMPLPYQGNIIEGIDIAFENGEVISYHAETNFDALESLIQMDNGSYRLGEVALVPNSSPIRQLDTLFYNVLFDENASSHLALGSAYPKNIKGGTEMSKDELIVNGGNNSLIHVDFMFGTPDMNVWGVREDGSEVLFFENGEFKGLA